MERSRLFYAVVLAVALLAAPAAWACGEMLMWMDCCAGEEGGHEPVVAPCHSSVDTGTPGIDTGAAGMDCCAAAAVAVPVQGVSFHNEAPVVGLELSILRPVSAAVAPTRVQAVPIDSSRLFDLGRYTLFSSFLL